MDEREFLEILGRVGAVITDSHIVYTSGKHGSAYVNKDALYPHTKETAYLCREIARRFLPYMVEVVIAPAVGGVILSQWTAHYLSKMSGREILGVYAEKPNHGNGFEIQPNFIVGRGYGKFIPGKNVLVEDDIVTTGGSAKKVIDAVRALGGNVIGLGALCNRGGITPSDVGDVPKLDALVNVTLDAWDAADCPLCKEGVPINTEVGKGREFLARKRLQHTDRECEA